MNTDKAVDDLRARVRLMLSETRRRSRTCPMCHGRGTLTSVRPMTERAAATEIGISTTALHVFLLGGGLRFETGQKIARWLEENGA